MNMLNEPGLMASETISPSNLLTDNLPLLAGAPNGIQKLRELILELAVRGKLVQQDPSDEPASELLKRIAEEKVQLIAKGKLRKQKPLADIDEAEKPFELPSNWEWTRLGEITNFGTTVKAEIISDDAWVLDLEDIEKDTSKLLRKACFSERNSLSDKNRFIKDDVLYGKLRPYLNKVIVADSEGFCTTEIIPFRCHGPFNPNYFKVALKSPYFLLYVNSKSYGMKMPRLGTEDGRHALFPLPPLAEQHRIVAKVDELMTLCDRLEAQQADAENAHVQLVQALLDSLTQASDADDFAASWQRLAEHFHTLFTTESSIDALKKTFLRLAADGRLVSSDMPADYLTLSDVIEGDSLNGSSKKPQDSPGTVEILRISAGTGVADFLTDEYEHKWADVTEAEIQKFLLTKDDLLACRFNGNLHYVGAFSLYCGNRGVAQIFPDKLIRFRADLNKALPHYLKYILNAAPARAQIESFCATTVGNIGISAKNLKTIKIRLPSLEEQSNIVGLLDHLMTLCEQLKTRLTQARQLNEQLAIALVEQAVA
ncbi:restriction endonuclease subunit S [Pseudomonas sp.]|uniref:restriction endonuclease subunit S n=1 Tax=Pseudomonas sp. TaxID=306 RepID=UPI00289DC7EF|nr:restriction endonuclease subunit S [Pseudomonas sp.]